MTKLAHSYSALKMYENCPLRYYHQRIIKSVKEQSGTATIYGERIHSALEHRLRDGTKLPDEAKHLEAAVRPLEKTSGRWEMLVEQEMTLNIKHKPTGWWDDDAWLRAKIDVLMLRDRRARVLDWKTGKRRPDFKQLELFALMVFEHYPDIDLVDAAFVWIKDMSSDSDRYERKSLPQMWENTINRIRRVEQSLENEVWPARPSGLCAYCPARHLCDYAQV